MENLVEISVDLVSAAKNSKGPLQGIDEHSLEKIARRYRMFLSLKRENPHIPFAPTGDIDEMWHLHMLHPVRYVSDCNRIFGFILDHNPGFGRANEVEYNELISDFHGVQRLWESTFKEPYIFAGSVNVESVVMCADKGSPKPDKDEDKSKTPADEKDKEKSNRLIENSCVLSSFNLDSSYTWKIGAEMSIADLRAS